MELASVSRRPATPAPSSRATSSASREADDEEDGSLHEVLQQQAVDGEAARKAAISRPSSQASSPSSRPVSPGSGSGSRLVTPRWSSRGGDSYGDGHDVVRRASHAVNAASRLESSIVTASGPSVRMSRQITEDEKRAERMRRFAAIIADSDGSDA